MNDLREYVRGHVERGACRCGNCIDSVPNPEASQSHAVHTADLVFFKVAAKTDATASALRALVEKNKTGEYANVDLFDGKEHNYVEIGAWIGDQGLALMLMGLGEIVGLWRLLTPYTVLGKDCPLDTAQHMAGQGLVAVVSA